LTPPPISVVVPVYNAARTIGACIAAIGKQDYPGEVELVVVDNGCTDASPAIIGQFAFARLIRCATRGPAAARNAGIAATRHPIIALTDSDCIPAPGWLSALVAANAPEIAGIGGRLESANPGPVEDLVAAISFNQQASLDSSMPYVITANCLFRRDALAAVGGFDESFPIAGGEDTDLGWRMTAAGARFAYADAALCLHNHPATRLDLVSQRMRYGYAMSLLWRKYQDSALGPGLAAILPSWEALCLTLAQNNGQTGPEKRLRGLAQAAYFAGWLAGGGRRPDSTPARRDPAERRQIRRASPAAALLCAGAAGAMVLTGRFRRIFRRA